MTDTQNLSAENISCAYNGRTVLDDVSLTLEIGKVTALLGQSGAGKSTLLRLFAGLERPASGEIRLGDTILSNANTMVPAEKRRIGLIFQDFALFPHLTAYQNIMFGLGHLTKAEAKTRAENWLGQIGLAHRADAFPHQLSGGEQQRIAIARALAPEPVAILMDEPFSGLDPAMREEVREIALASIAATNTPALLVTHNAREAMLSADHLAIIRAGQISQAGRPEHIYTQPVDKETAAALGPIILVEGKTGTDTGTIETPFGPFEHRAAPRQTPINVGLRPEAFEIDADSPIKAQVISARRQGALIQLHIERDGHSAKILITSTHAPEAKAEIGLRLNPNLCVVF